LQGDARHHSAEASAEPVLPAPEAVAELEAAAPEAAASAPAAAPAAPAPPETAAPASPEANGRAHVEVEYPIGSTRQRILDHFLDSEGDQTVAQILAAMPPGTSRNTLESGLRREHESGRLLRVAPGVYRLAPPKRPGQPAPPPEPEPGSLTDEQWLTALEAWLADGAWDQELGPAIDQPGPHKIPREIAARFKARLRRRDDGAAAAKERANADAALRDQLIAACNGNYSPGPGLDDLAPIKLALELVPLESILTSLRHAVDRLMCPTNEPATSWREPRLLKRIALDYCRYTVATSLVAAWSTAKPPQKRAAAPAPVAEGDPPGTPETSPGKPVDASEAAPATSPPPDLENAPAVPPPQPDRVPDGNAGNPGIEALAQPTRESILGSFLRNRPQPQPAAPPPAPPRSPQPQPRPPERQAERRAEPEPLNDAAVDELLAGYAVGNLAWPRRQLGPKPGEPGCRIPLAVLKRNRLA